MRASHGKNLGFDIRQNPSLNMLIGGGGGGVLMRNRNMVVLLCGWCSALLMAFTMYGVVQQSEI